MEVFVIKSIYSDTPLAEIRTDGVNIDWVLDNTQGKLPSMSGNSFLRLKEVVGGSHHLAMETQTQPTIGILRYSLENSDIVEVTTDGKTALLNGKIISEEEKYGLMTAINSGKIKVKNKADIQRPIPVIPKVKREEKKQQSNGLQKYMHSNISKLHSEDKEKEQENNRFRDSSIDSIDFSGTDYPERGRQLLYILKYGEGNV